MIGTVAVLALYLTYGSLTGLGLAFIAMGGSFWRWHYGFGAACLLAVPAMIANPGIGSLLFGIVSGVACTLVARYLRKLDSVVSKSST